MAKRTRDESDPDLIQLDHIELTPNVVVVQTPFGPAWANTIGADAWADAQHNKARYAELQKLRNGQANLYHATRYRNG